MRLNFNFSILFVVFFSGCATYQPVASYRNLAATVHTPYIWSTNKLLLVQKDLILKEKSQYWSEFQKLLAKASEDLNKAPLSVVQKTNLGPSGDPHDFVSIIAYAWPNPAGAKLPYIIKDGIENAEEMEKYTDAKNFTETIARIERLSLAFFFTRDDKYANQASKFLRTWFINSDTKMNPNLKFGQFLQNTKMGTGFGIVQTRRLLNLLDSLSLLRLSPSYTFADQNAMKAWFKEYYTWLINSPLGKEERDHENNHGTFYDVQIASIAIYLGDIQSAKKILENVIKKRIPIQIESDGKQPLELVRTRSLGYSLLNLEGLFNLAQLGEISGVDLWNYKSKSGGSIEKAAEFLAPYITNEKQWELQQNTKYDTQPLCYLSMKIMLKFPNVAKDRKFEPCVSLVY